MTDRRARRSSIYLDKEQAALDLKEARALKLADGASPSTASSVAGRDPVEVRLRGTSTDPEKEHPAPHS
jgi:hypothetical protein